MDHFNHIDGHLHAEQVPVEKIAAQFGTPCYVYSRATLERHWHAFDDALGAHPHRICYAVKANGNLAILNLFARLGGGFDIVSGGELRRVLAAGGDPRNTIFSGVCKQDWEIREALEVGVGCFNIESEDELNLLSACAAKQKKIAAVSVRLNPDVDAKTHPYISTGLRENKFGLSAARALAVYQRADADRHLRVSGVACHIGSQLTELAPYQDAMRRVLAFIAQLQAVGITVDHIDFGGGLGVRYGDETPPTPAEYATAIVAELRAHNIQLPITIEPGRAIVGNAGILVTRVHNLKYCDGHHDGANDRHGDGNDDRHGNGTANFCVVDAGMNDFIRPALYQAAHEIVEVQAADVAAQQYDVVGPVCESSDFLGKSRWLKVRAGDLLAVRTAGAYGTAMSSNYNARARPAEVMVDGAQCHLIRARESLDALFRDEQMLPA